MQELLDTLTTITGIVTDTTTSYDHKLAALREIYQTFPDDEEHEHIANMVLYGIMAFRHTS